ncbi:DUF6190 family protein [Litoribrevibacter euphylliae]|uniref:DUF6190 family protein n=1 Tax=Litoribrevibacter euphylliae TaxID=1834034 RepID=A0ABV7H7J2_9GAMM
MTSTNKKIFIDASLFMGMHSEDELTRQSSLRFFTEYFSHRIFMNLEQVGMCDELVWQYERHIQDDYYPFMDVLHSEMDIQRIGYTTTDLEELLRNPLLNSPSLGVQQKLLLAQVINRNGILYTHDTVIHAIDAFQPYLGEFHTDSEDLHQQSEFCSPLNALYETSKVLVFPYNAISQGSENYVK